MYKIFMPLLALSLPLLVLAQASANAPILVIEDGASNQPITKPKPVPSPEFSNFPENAITRVGENTMGTHEDVPATPASPVPPAAPAATANPETPKNPASPAAPANPNNKLWPRDTVRIFLPPCTRLRPQFVVPCTCVITKLMIAMPHDEFLKKSEDGTIEQDPRLIKIRSECATAPQRKE
jgi:hypothetical protein